MSDRYFGASAKLKTRARILILHSLRNQISGFTKTEIRYAFTQNMLGIRNFGNESNAVLDWRLECSTAHSAVKRAEHWTDFHLNYFQIMINIDEHSHCTHSDTFLCHFEFDATRNWCYYILEIGAAVANGVSARVTFARDRIYWLYRHCTATNSKCHFVLYGECRHLPPFAAQPTSATFAFANVVSFVLNTLNNIKHLSLNLFC